MKELDFNENDFSALWIEEEQIFNQDEPKTIAELYCTEDDNDFLTFTGTEVEDDDFNDSEYE